MVSSRPFRFALLALGCALLVSAPAAVSAATGPVNDWHPVDDSVRIPPLVASHIDTASSDQMLVYSDVTAHSADSGVTWTTTRNPCLFASGAQDPSDWRTVYGVCSSPGALWRSTDGGQTWSKMTLTDPGSGEGAVVLQVAVAAGTPHTVYALGTDPSDSHVHDTALFTSNDGGQTWASSAIPQDDNSSLQHMVVDPSDSGHVIVSPGYDLGTSTVVAEITHDSGASWTEDSSIGLAPWAAQYDPADPSHLWGIGQNGVLRSTDGGHDWSAVAGAPANASGIVVGDGWVYAWNADVLALSTDGGATWQSTSFVLPTEQWMEVDGLAVDSTDFRHIAIHSGANEMTWETEFTPSLPASEGYQASALEGASDITPTSATVAVQLAPMLTGSYGFVNWSWNPVSDSGDVTTATTDVSGDDGAQARLVTHSLTGLKPGTTYQVQCTGGFEFPGGSLFGGCYPAMTFTTLPSVAPRITRAPVAALAMGQVTSGHIPATVSWASEAGTYAVGKTTIGRRVDGGAWKSAGSTAKSTLATSVELGHTVQFRAQAGDGHGTLSTATAGPSGKVSFKDDAGAAASWAGSWSKVRSSTAVDHTLRTSSAGAASVTLHFTGRSIAVIAPKGRNLAAFTAVLDGQAKGKLSTSASSLSPRRTLAVWSFTTSGKHTLVLHVARSSGHTLAELDGFVVLG